MYTDRNFKTKKALKDAVAAWNTYRAAARLTDGDNPLFAGSNPNGPPAVTYFQPGPFGGNEPKNGTFSIEGPHYPEPHKWYARVTAKDGVIVSVK
jgi:hypothetical protein